MSGTEPRTHSQAMSPEHKIRELELRNGIVMVGRRPREMGNEVRRGYQVLQYKPKRGAIEWNCDEEKFGMFQEIFFQLGRLSATKRFGQETILGGPFRTHGVGSKVV